MPQWPSRDACPRRREGSSCDGQDLVTDQVEANSLGSGLVEKERCCRLKHVLAQLLPRIPLSEDVFGKALSAISAVGFLDDFEHQFCHTHMIRHGISRARFINPHKSSSRRESQFRDSSHDAPSTSPPTASVVLPAGLPASIQTPHIRSRQWLVAREVMSSDRNRLQSLVDALRATEGAGGHFFSCGTG